MTQTYHLDRPSLYPYRPFRLPRVGKLLLPKEGWQVAEVWDVPPQRTYASVKWMAGVLAAIGLLWYTVAATWRDVARRREATTRTRRVCVAAKQPHA
ncbi:MAG: hypothetical protein MUC83_09950 [Pirellula sp.]|nr:hypothetical protein [Pirellula sp.]